MKSAFAKLLSLLVVALIIVEAFNLSRPLPAFGASPQKIQMPETSAVNLPWPLAGQAAIGTQKGGILETHGPQKPAPIASIAKVIAALAVLKKYPLATGQQGPTITLDQRDVDSLNYYYSHDGSVATVANGEKISEYQALQAMMLPSANNMADSLTNWAFGSSGAYVDYANQMVKDMGMENTTVASASGFLSDTLSTASDLIILGQAALNNPLIADVVNQSTANIPVAGVVRNVNWLLGEDGVIGIKTGNTDKAGGCFLFAAERTVQGHNVTLLGAVVGDTTLNQALVDSRRLISASDTGFQTVKIKKGQVVGKYTAPWSGSAKAVTGEDVNMLVWRGQKISAKADLNEIGSSSNGTKAGKLNVAVGNEITSVPVVTNSAINQPSLFWRPTHF